MTSGGYVKIFRKIQDHQWPASESACQRWAWVDLILLASHNCHCVEIGGHRVELDRGDFVASTRFLARRWNWGLPKTASFLDKLHVDCQLEKKRNGSGNGSPSIYHIVNYDLYQGEAMLERNGFQNACGTVAERLRNKTKKGKKGKVISEGKISLERYLNLFQETEQEILRQAIRAVSSTRRSGKVAGSVFDRLAQDLSRYPGHAVVSACRIYVEKDYASQGKGEKYLLGIVRGEFKRNGQGSGSTDPNVRAKTPGLLAIERALQRQAQEAEGWDDL